MEWTCASKFQNWLVPLFRCGDVRRITPSKKLRLWFVFLLLPNPCVFDFRFFGADCDVVPLGPYINEFLILISWNRIFAGWSPWFATMCGDRTIYSKSRLRKIVDVVEGLETEQTSQGLVFLVTSKIKRESLCSVNYWSPTHGWSSDDDSISTCEGIFSSMYRTSLFFKTPGRF